MAATGRTLVLEDDSGYIKLEEDDGGVLLLEGEYGPLNLNNYLSVDAGSGMSTTEKIR